jgi:phosphoenolpyruvate carboxykinase (GTP)
MNTQIHSCPTKHADLARWVRDMAVLCGPDSVVWCDGSDSEKDRLTELAVKTGDLIRLDQEKLPGCYYHRSAPNDVARTENLTFICSRKKEDAGPNNNWMAPEEAYQKLGGIFRGSMKGRTMYVVPFIMGPVDSPYSKVGVQLTDSVYVVLNMRIMTRMGKRALDRLGDAGEFTRCLHGKADLNIDRRFICHFPEDNAVWSVGSGYGGNALLGKKCLALRIGSYLGQKQGWMAEHMLILGIQDPQGRVRYILAAFPSQCGKTNMAMLVPPDEFKKRGYKVWTVGDDIAWLHVGADGRLYAINPEAGFFGVAPGTNKDTNPNALATIQKNTIYTNVLLKKDNTVWWEGLEAPPAEGIDWRGQRWTPDSTEKGAHPNSRFTAPASQCPSISPEWENPAGVPISAIIFGGRRAKLEPLAYESFSWEHGTYVGASTASETTAAATGQVGIVRRDPMAMLPFCGYNMGDYFGHWIRMGKKMSQAPKIFHVNWFRKDETGKTVWPGFGDNLRVLLWMLDRCEGKGAAVRTPLGYLPTYEAIDFTGLDLKRETLEKLLWIDRNEWKAETEAMTEYFKSYGDRIPQEMWRELDSLKERLG